ncbi:MAG: methionine synthase [Leptospiraceae bacterium]|nr:methionine synthase [Leptospiraceae bacterium]MCP5496701.1 methionine synthase [Leptospiraceae bacterium]
MAITEKQFIELLQEKLLVIDGAMGTSLQNQNLTAQDFGGVGYEGCNEYLLISKPEAIKKVHLGYLEAGCDIIETNTFGSTPIVLSEYGLQNRAYEISKLGAVIAKESVKEYTDKAKPNRKILVAGSIGPTTKTISVTGGVNFQELIDSFYIQAKGLLDGDCDMFLIETAQDTLNIKAGLIAINQLFREYGKRIPIMISGTIEPMGSMLGGQNIEALAISTEHARPITIGLNCATGPSFMTDHIRTLASSTSSYVSCVPNAGLPDENGLYNESPEDIVKVLDKFVDSGWVNLIGGCCGTTPEHIRLMAEMTKGKKPRIPVAIKKTRVSGIEPLIVEEENRPYMVAERTNSLGSRIFRQLIADEKFEEASEIARKQIRAGAQIIDVCLQNPDRDEITDMKRFISVLVKKVRAPIMIDSTDEKVLDVALKYCQGKTIYNSINLENGEERFEVVAPILKQYGAAVVVGCIDDNKEQGMGVTVARKLEIAEKSHKLLTQKYQIPEEDIIFDPLVFPVGTGDETYILSAEATIQGVAAIKKRFPKCKTILGISNVSFGLPDAGREVLNSVFLYHNVKAGLDMAIVNTQKLERYPSILEHEKKLAEDLLFHTTESYSKALGDFAEYFKGKLSKAKEKKDMSSLSLDERLSLYIVEGAVDGLIDDLNLKLVNTKPLDIVNGPLMTGMAEVGRLFNDNQLIVSEVLQSAESMKKAVSHLEQYMEKTEDSIKGRMVLATVKGDVHDIGKNLVDIIFSNNGYKVINLGIKIPPEDIIKACKEHKPDMLGLSGLLVKSAQQMTITAADLRDAGINVPMLVGGAALSEAFTRNKIASNYEGTVIYAKDAMNGLDLANQLMSPIGRKALEEEWSKPFDESHKEQSKQRKRESEAEKVEFRYDYGILTPPSLTPQILKNVSLDLVYPYVNPVMLYKKHLGYKGRVGDGKSVDDPKFVELCTKVSELQDEVISKQLYTANGIYQFFRAGSDGDELVILDSTGKKELEVFRFPRQKFGAGLCLSDFVAPLGSGREDFICMFLVTAGIGVREKAEELKNKGEFLKSHMLSALALETAEAFAEFLHQKIREMWGIQDPTLSMQEIFQAKYTGIRVSFGYPACPNLEDQEKLFRLLLPPKDLGVSLTEGYMMEPEASVSAIVFQHPMGRYFSVKDNEE